jgi:hypothetical protein
MPAAFASSLERVAIARFSGSASFEIAAVGRDVVIRRRQRAFRHPRRDAALAQHLERGRGAVLQQVPVDVEQALAVRLTAAGDDFMARPDLVEQRLRLGVHRDQSSFAPEMRTISS